MQTIQHSISQGISVQSHHKPAGTGLFSWCEKQEVYHFAWVAAILAVQSCILIPVTLLSILVNGNVQTLLIALLAVTAMSLISILSAMSTRYTIPVFAIALMVDILICVAGWFHLVN